MAVTDFFFPALTAVGQQLAFFVQHMMRNPKAVERVQKEIDDVVGPGRYPELDDRIK